MGLYYFCTDNGLMGHSLFQKNVVVLHNSVVRNAVLVAPADALHEVVSLQSFQLVVVASVQNEVNGGVDGLHLLLPDDGVALFHFVQKVRVVRHRQQGRDGVVRAEAFQLSEHGLQLGQHCRRGRGFKMLAHDVPFRICMAARARL